MENTEKKQAKWESLFPKYKHLDQYCTIDVKGLDNDSIYFHPTFRLDENTHISSQADCGNNTRKGLYAFKFEQTGEIHFSIDIDEGLLDVIVIGFSARNDIVLEAMLTLARVKKHVDNINIYVSDYIRNVLIGNSIKDITRQITNELASTERVVEHMKKK